MEGIKETLEIFAFLKSAAVAVKAAKADGRVDWRDALNPETRQLLPKFMEMIQGSQRIKLEVLDLTAAETQEVVDAAITSAHAFMEALLS